MKDELQTKLVEILTSIQSAAGKAGDFAIAQLPDIAQSYVMYGRMMETAYMMLCLVFVALCAALLFIQSRKDDAWSEPTPMGFAAIASCVPALMAMVIAFSNIGSFLMVWFAPKVWLIKEIASILR